MAHESLAIVRLVSQTGLPADTVEMQFAFSNAPQNGGSGSSVYGVLDAFLNATYAGVGSLGSFLAGSLRHDVAPEVDVYDISGALSGGHRGSPVSVGTLGDLATPSVDTDLPLQAAIGLSYHSDLSGLAEFGATVADLPTPEEAQDFGAPATHSGVSRPKASRRGRMFFGPLNEAAMLSSVLRIREPDTDFVNVAKAAMAALASESTGWSVWSRREAALHQITGGWIANATDVVRRRRLKATTRTLWP